MPPRATGINGTQEYQWRGRMAVRIDSSQPQAFTASFDLTGTSLAGELILYTPLGATAATLTWTPHTALMRTNDEVRSFNSLNDLIQQAVGTNIPVDALFAWLAGEDFIAAGWRADLSQHGNGRITAKRLTPLPAAELRLVLEK